GRLKLGVVPQVEDVLLLGQPLVSRVAQIRGLLGEHELERLASTEHVRRIGGDSDVLILKDDIPFPSKIRATRVTLEVVGEDDVRVAGDSNISRMPGGNPAADIGRTSHDLGPASGSEARYG